MDLVEARKRIGVVDEQMASLFVERMEAARAVAACKREAGLPIEDKAQEAHVIERGVALVADDELRPYYVEFLQNLMKLSKDWQRHLLEK